jgi:hypothetical protein
MIKKKFYYLDDVNDKELILWLEKQTNQSAFIRLLLYDKMSGVIVRIPPSSDSGSTVVAENNNFKSSMKNFIKKEGK